MKRIAVFLYGLCCYLIFFLSFVYAIGFVGDFIVPKTIDSGTAGPFWQSLLINLGLLGVFGLQHSGMARVGFKRWWTKIVPEPMERSTYVLLSSLSLILIFWFWQPLPEVIWSVESGLGGTILWMLYGLGWGLVLLATFMISHAHLFGVRQVHDFLKRRAPHQPGFQTPGLYRHMRHPIMTGFLIAFWATPHMTVGHLLFAAVTSLYILVALQLEERDLVKAFGEKYRAYRERVPMFIPRPSGTEAAARTAASQRQASGPAK